jgi:hypothetical protein
MIQNHSVDQFPVLDIATYFSILQGIAQRDNKTQNGSFSRPLGSDVIPVDTSIPPLRLPPQPSRFFSTPSVQSSNIIAVDSSPERPPPSGPTYVPHQSHSSQNPYGTGAYGPPRGGMYQDPFAPSTLVRNPHMIRPGAHDAHGPPRKKQNTGRSSADIILVEDSPESSPVARGWTGSSRTVLTSPLVDDDESPGPNRIRRGRPGEGMFPPESPTAHRTHVKQPSLSMTSFANAFPQATEDEIQRAITISQGDWGRVVGILQALVQNKEQSHSISIAAQQEQQRKEKEMARQRKNKSAIYANRTAAPAQAAPPPVKRNNDDSDSDGDDFKGDGFDSDASDADDRAKDSELEIICTAEAIEYFNTADAESLVMMIGM